MRCDDLKCLRTKDTQRILIPYSHSYVVHHYIVMVIEQHTEIKLAELRPKRGAFIQPPCEKGDIQKHKQKSIGASPSPEPTNAE